MQTKKQFLTTQDIQKLWDIMSRAFPTQWLNDNPSDDGTWLNGLAGITPEQLAYGVQKTLSSTNEWPPNLPKFRNYCLNVDMAGLSEFTKKYAMKMHGFDTFHQNQMTYSQIEKAISPYKNEAKEAYIEQKSDEAYQITLQLIEHKKNNAIELDPKDTEDFDDDIPY